MQIVIYGRAREVHRVHWTFTHIPQGAAPARQQRRGADPELPL
jgi:hypothetical protein